MGCLKLHINTEPTLSVAYRKKGQKVSKNRGSYYPFGLKHKGYNNVINGTDHPYGYNGKELEESLGFDMYEFDWRGYDASIGRFNTVDPFSELYPQLDKSPYAYAWNNPIVFNDPSGLCPDCPSVDGAIVGEITTIENGSQYIFNGTEWERYTVEELDEVVVNGKGSSKNEVDTSENVSLNRLKPLPVPIEPKPPTTTAPKAGPLAAAYLIFQLTVHTSPHPDDIANILDPGDYSNKKRDETAVMRFQFQQGHTNISSTTAYNSAEIGVTVNQAKVGLAQMHNLTEGQYLKVISSWAGQNAMHRLKKKISSLKPLGIIGGTRTTLQETFTYKGKVYRIDVESIRGHNLRQ